MEFEKVNGNLLITNTTFALIFSAISSKYSSSINLPKKMVVLSFELIYLRIVPGYTLLNSSIVVINNEGLSELLKLKNRLSIFFSSLSLNIKSIFVESRFIE